MPTYFPYSQIIVNIYNNILENVGRHPFFTEWSVSEEEQYQSQSAPAYSGEAYY